VVDVDLSVKKHSTFWTGEIQSFELFQVLAKVIVPAFLSVLFSILIIVCPIVTFAFLRIEMIL
jgi:hypothetical protein